MAYQFPPDIDQLIKNRLASGNYTSEDDVLRDAMGALEQLDQDRLACWEQRNRLAMEQSASGLSRTLDDDKVLARLRERLVTRSAAFAPLSRTTFPKELGALPPRRQGLTASGESRGIPKFPRSVEDARACATRAIPLPGFRP